MPFVICPWTGLRVKSTLFPIALLYGTHVYQHPLTTLREKMSLCIQFSSFPKIYISYSNTNSINSDNIKFEFSFSNTFRFKEANMVSFGYGFQQLFPL